MEKSEEIRHTLYETRIHTHIDVIISDITAVMQRNRKPTPNQNIVSHDCKPVSTDIFPLEN